MSGRLQTFANRSLGPLTPVAVGYATVGGVLLVGLVLASTAVLSRNVTALVPIAAFFVGAFTAANQLFPFAVSHFDREKSTAACKETVRRPQWVMFDLTRREQMLGWGSVGAAVAAVGAFVWLLFL